MMKPKFKVACDEIFDPVYTMSTARGNLWESGSDVTGEVMVYKGGEDSFPQEEVIAGKISFEFSATDPVPLWGFASDMKSARALVDYLAWEAGENPGDVYHRWIHPVS